MSLYEKEKAEYFCACMQSVIDQTVQPSEIVIVIDGPLTPSLDKALTEYSEASIIPIKEIRCPVNRGLGIALSVGVPACSYDLIARMDTDDIARRDRFEKQLELFKAHPELDICGSHICEFEGCVDNVVSTRKVPLTHDEIAAYQKTRSAFNHMTVMFRKDKVLSAGNYRDVPLMEDDSLWVRMLLDGARCANIDDTLVFARIDGGMIDRRGGWDYFKKYRKARREILKTGYIGKWDYYKTIITQLVVAMVPTTLRRLIFLRLLRK